MKKGFPIFYFNNPFRFVTSNLIIKQTLKDKNNIVLCESFISIKIKTSSPTIINFYYESKQILSQLKN